MLMFYARKITVAMLLLMKEACSRLENPILTLQPQKCVSSRTAAPKPRAEGGTADKENKIDFFKFWRGKKVDDL